MYVLFTYSLFYITEHCTAERFSVPLFQFFILEMLHALIVHSNVYTFFMLLFIYRRIQRIVFVDEFCGDLVAPLLCCMHKDHSNLEVSVITRMAFKSRG
jgi:hypothetical protein